MYQIEVQDQKNVQMGKSINAGWNKSVSRNFVLKRNETSLVIINKISFGSWSTFNFEAWNSITIATFLLCFICKKVCIGNVSKTNKWAGWNMGGEGKQFSKFQNVQTKIRPCRWVFFFKTNKLTCTSIWYTRVHSSTKKFARYTHCFYNKSAIGVPYKVSWLFKGAI